MTDRKLLGTGIIGSVIAAVCCFTPVLVAVFAGLGISALMGWWLDYFVLYPALAFFLALIGYALFRRRRKTAGDAASGQGGPAT